MLANIDVFVVSGYQIKDVPWYIYIKPRTTPFSYMCKVSAWATGVMTSIIVFMKWYKKYIFIVIYCPLSTVPMMNVPVKD